MKITTADLLEALAEKRAEHRPARQATMIPKRASWYCSVGTWGSRVNVRESSPGGTLYLEWHANRMVFRRSTGHRNRATAKRQATKLAAQLERQRAARRAAQIDLHALALDLRPKRRRKTQCWHGHTLTPESIYIERRPGYRARIRCGICERARNARRRARVAK